MGFFEWVVWSGFWNVFVKTEEENGLEDGGGGRCERRVAEEAEAEAEGGEAAVEKAVVAIGI